MIYIQYVIPYNSLFYVYLQIYVVIINMYCQVSYIWDMN